MTVSRWFYIGLATLGLLALAALLALSLLAALGSIVCAIAVSSIRTVSSAIMEVPLGAGGRLLQVRDEAWEGARAMSAGGGRPDLAESEARMAVYAASALMRRARTAARLHPICATAGCSLARPRL